MSFKTTVATMRPAVVVVMTVLPAFAAYGQQSGDTESFSKLRTQYIEAAESNDPAAVGALVTEDFVLLQPNKNGPDTYGKDAHIAYRESLFPLSNLNIEILQVVRCGNDWALEIGREHADWRSPEKVFGTTARFFKLINRSQAHGWRYARVVMGWDTNSYMPPPAPGDIFNAGYGTWQPPVENSPSRAEARQFIRDMETSIRTFSATGDLVTPMRDQLSPIDESTGELIALGPWGEKHGLDEYMAARQESAKRRNDDLRKQVEEVIFCEPDMAFSWGQTTDSGVVLATGERYMNIGDFMYMHRKHDGRWKVGPHGTAYSEIDPSE